MLTKKCGIIVNGFYTNGAIEHQVFTLKAELLAKGVEAIVIKGDTLPCYIDGTEARITLSQLDFCIYLDKDVHTARLLERCGVKIFNSARAIELCDDKMLTNVSLVGSGVNMPLTISSPIMYREAEDGDFLDRVEEKIAYPVVVKEVFGSMGRGVHLAKNRTELEELRSKLKLKPHLYQQFIGRGGEDKRVILVGGEIIAAMQRRNEGDFRSNIEHGGTGYPTELTEEEAFIAKRAAEVLGLDYCGVDILTDESGRAYFCEANSNAFFKGIQAVTGVNVANAFVLHICGKVYGN